MLDGASAYADPSLPYVVAILSVSALIGGFESTKLAEASRSLSLARVTQLELASQLAGFACMIGWAAVHPSIWALVAGGLCAAAVRAGLSHRWLPGAANRWQWDRAACREILGFGKWIFAASVLGFFVNSADRLILGALVSTSVLGVYAIAYLLFSSVEAVLVKVVADVAYPALSEVARERPAALRAAYYRFHLAIGMPACAVAGLLMVSGEPLVALLYDARYAQAGWMLEILALALVTLGFRVATQCFMVLGAPTPVGFHWFGLGGALAAIVASHFAWLPSAIAFAIRRGLFDARKELALAAALAAGALAGSVLNHVL
jgi:O-antigen/teichoic acid export membrane protein